MLRVKNSLRKKLLFCFFSLLLVFTSVPRTGAQVASPGNVTFDFKEVDIRTVLHYLSEVSGVDIVPLPGVEGNVTMRLRDKPWQVALDLVTRNYGYVHSREGDIIRVIPKDQIFSEAPKTTVIPLNHIIRETQLRRRSGQQETDLEVEREEEAVGKVIESIEGMLHGDRGESVTFVPSINSLVVTAIPSRIGVIEDLIGKVDRRTPQIMLSAKVIEIDLSQDERFGVDWNAVISAAGARSPITFPFDHSSGLIGLLPDSQSQFFPEAGYSVDGVEGYLRDGSTQYPGAVATVWELDQFTREAMSDHMYSFGTLDFTTFSATLSMLEARGDAEVLSAPRITTLNNRPATIKVVEKIMMQRGVEGIEGSRTVVVEFEQENQAREVGVVLSVVPHINEEGDISVNLMPEVSTNAGFQALDVGDSAQKTVALKFQSREANTTVRVRDGETIFIGGLIRENLSTRETQFPILGDIFGGIPFVRRAFRYESDQVTRSEVVFFVTVNLIKDGPHSMEVSETYPRFKQHLQPGYGSITPRARIQTDKLEESAHETVVDIPVADVTETNDYSPPVDFRDED